MGREQVIDAPWAFGTGVLLRLPAGEPESRSPSAVPRIVRGDPSKAATGDASVASAHPLIPRVERMAGRDEGALEESDATLAKVYRPRLRMLRSSKKSWSMPIIRRGGMPAATTARVARRSRG